jgi:hypothetical protein
MGAVTLALAVLALWLLPGDPPREKITTAPQGVSRKPAEAAPRAPVPQPVAAPAANRGEATEPPAAGGDEAQRPLLPPAVPPALQPPSRELRTLSRARVEAALAHESALDRQFETSRSVHDGHRLLKLGYVGPGSFYAELGLESRDVLLLVDGEWVTDLGNPLWAALRSRDELVLVVMRRGTPRSWRVRIE